MAQSARATAAVRRVAGCAVAVLAAAATSGIWAPSSWGAESPKTVLRHGAEKALAQHSAHTETTLTFDEGRHSLLVMKLVGTETFGAPIQGNLSTTVLSGTTGTTVTIPEILDGTAIYVQEGGAWYLETAQQALAQEGVSGSLQSSGNPAQALAFLYQNGAKVTVVGHSHAGGVALTEYHSSVTISKGFKPPGGFTFSPKFLKLYKTLTGGAPMGIDAWLDHSGVLRREQVHIPLSRSGLESMGLSHVPKGTSMQMIVRFSTFGVPVTVTVPATAKPLPTAGSSQT